MTRPASSIDPRLARRLREIRKSLGLSACAVAGKIGWSESKISRVEKMRAGVTAEDVRILLDIYTDGVSAPERTALIGLARRSAEQAFRGRPRTAQEIVYRNEAAAAETWGPSLVPPLLRTPEYARAVAASAQDITGALPSAVAETTVISRAWQRRIKSSRRPLRVQAVIDATALLRQAGKLRAEDMRGQVEYLAELDALPNVTLMTIPLNAACPAGFGAFTLLQFDLAGELPLSDVAVFDDSAGPRTVDGEADTYRCHRTFSNLASQAEPPAAAIAAALARW